MIWEHFGRWKSTIGAEKWYYSRRFGRRKSEYDMLGISKDSPFIILHEHLPKRKLYAQQLSLLLLHLQPTRVLFGDYIRGNKENRFMWQWMKYRFLTTLQSQVSNQPSGQQAEPVQSDQNPDLALSDNYSFANAKQMLTRKRYGFNERLESRNVKVLTWTEPFFEVFLKNYFWSCRWIKWNFGLKLLVC